MREAAQVIAAISRLADPRSGTGFSAPAADFASWCAALGSPPSVQRSELQRFDSLVRQAFSTLTSLHPNEAEWDQVTRGFDTAGLSLRSAALHSLGACLASRAFSYERCREIDGHHV